MADYYLSGRYGGGSADSAETAAADAGPVSMAETSLSGFELEQQIDGFALKIKRAVREMREEAGLSQVELAEELNVRQSVISRLENLEDPRRPTFGTLLRVAAACGYQLSLGLLYKGLESGIVKPQLQVERTRERGEAVEEVGEIEEVVERTRERGEVGR